MQKHAFCFHFCHAAKVMKATNVNAPEVMLFCGSGVECIAWLVLLVCC
jgi:hypothetical protein